MIKMLQRHYRPGGAKAQANKGAALLLQAYFYSLGGLSVIGRLIKGFLDAVRGFFYLVGWILGLAFVLLVLLFVVVFFLFY